MPRPNKKSNKATKKDKNYKKNEIKKTYKPFYEELKISDFFPNKNGVDKNKLLIAPETRYSITMPKNATEIGEIIVEYMKKISKNKITITDATANVGGNTIGFAMNKEIKKVNSIEIDKNTCDMLQNNIKTYKLTRKVKVICDDYIKIMNNENKNKNDKIEQDVIFFDPPWGGPSYKRHRVMSLYLSDKNTVDIINDLKDKTKMVVFKIPRNFDFGYFYKKITYTDTDKIILYKKDFKGFYVLVLLNNDYF